jgi:hypothetical protein
MTRKQACAGLMGAMAALIVCVPANAQDALTNVVGATDAGAPTDDYALPPGAKVELTGGTKEKVASLALNVLDLANLVTPGGILAKDTSLELVLSTPWDKENDSYPVDLDGLADGTSLKLNFLQFVSGRESGRTSGMIALENDAIALCLADSGRKIGAKPEEAKKKCSLSETESLTLIDAYLSDKQTRAYSAGAFKSDLLAIGLHGGVEWQSFDYFDPLSLAENEEDHKSWEFGGSLTWYLRETPTAFTVSAEYERAYESVDEVILCPAPVGATPATCVQGPNAAPALEKAVKLTANLRHRFFAGDRLSNIAISPRVTFDASNRDAGIELPVYFIPNSDAGLVAGAKAGYTTKKDDFVFGVFVGAAFGLFQ